MVKNIYYKTTLNQGLTTQKYGSFRKSCWNMVVFFGLYTFYILEVLAKKSFFWKI